MPLPSSPTVADGAARARLAKALFRPSTVALYGASGDAAKYTSRPQRFLRKHGFAGRIVPINPNRDEILGERAYPNLTAVPGAIDHVFVMVGADRAVDAIRECAALEIPVATIFSDGFAEAGEAGRARQRALLAAARAGSVRLIGPNCLGVVNTHAPFYLSTSGVLEMDEVARGSLSLVSQSGSMLGALLTRAHARGFGVSKLVSVGNEADLAVGEIVDLLVDDPDTGTILLFLETLRDADRLAHAARRAQAARKSVVAYKLGRSEFGRDVAASHTGALAGSDEAVDAFFRHHGIMRVNMLETLLEIAPLAAGRAPAERKRVAVVTTTGGGAGAVVDALGGTGLDVVPPPDALVQRLRDQDVGVSTGRIVDLTMAGTRRDVASMVLDSLLDSDHCDIVVSVVGGSSKFQPELAVDPIVSAPRDKPLAVFLSPEAGTSLDLLRAAGIAAFRTPEACADALRAFGNWAPPVAAEPDSESLRSTAVRLERVLSQLVSGTLSEIDSRAVFDALGVPQAKTQVMASPDASADVPYPVALKILSRDIAHKSDAGGVALDIADAPALRSAARHMWQRMRDARPHARLDGLVVQTMERGLIEAIIGYKHDEQVGPLVIVGLGGVLAEVTAQFALRLAPVTLDMAHRMIEEVRGFAVIRGYRGLPRGDCDALARAVRAVSLLALSGGRVREAELNPVIIKAAGSGVVAVDGLVRLADKEQA